MVIDDCLGRINYWLRNNHLNLAADKIKAILVPKRIMPNTRGPGQTTWKFLAALRQLLVIRHQISQSKGKSSFDIISSWHTFNGVTLSGKEEILWRTEVFGKCRCISTHRENPHQEGSQDEIKSKVEKSIGWKHNKLNGSKTWRNLLPSNISYKDSSFCQPVYAIHV